MSVVSTADESEGNVERSEAQHLRADSNLPLRTTLAHQGYTLIGTAFVVFECGFLILYSNQFWFDLNVTWLGIPVAIAALLVTHFFLLWSESESGCNFFAPIWRRRPPCVYRQWVRLNEADLDPGLSFGQRHVIWIAIDQVELTFWGNLRVLSRALCGSIVSEPVTKKKFFSFSRNDTAEEILKFPFSMACLADQKLVVETMRRYNPSLQINERLSKRLDAKEVKGTVYVQQLGVVFLFVVLMDVGLSMFSYLEMMKNYYLCESASISEKTDEEKKAPQFFAQAESIREHPLPFSWVSNKIMHEGKVASGLEQTRAEALWAIGRKEEAITSMRKSLELSPNSFRLNLRLARLLALSGKKKEAIEQLNEGMKNHESALLPRLYMLALHPVEARPRFYKLYLHDLDDELFGNDLMWPPGSHVFLQDVFYRDDLTFIFDRLLYDSHQEAGSPPGAKL